ncbi:MAG: hypothetical protein PUD16_09090 [bacterium]|nr:hypothetical protein [bacterium]
MGLVVIVMFFVPPVVAVIYAIVSIVQLARVWKDEEARKQQMPKAIVSTAVTLVLAGLILWFIISLMYGIANM